ncbi:MAG: hypothetical protein HY961_17840 [Ignavibacteriae bacterium]|nr:hypothetical protein [Ignavibacteriota bacterium]
MGDYFRNLNNLDPHLNALVVTKLKEIQRREGRHQISINDLNEKDELELLREYCINLYREYRTLRNMFLENMHDPSRKERLHDRRN